MLRCTLCNVSYTSRLLLREHNSYNLTKHKIIKLEQENKKNLERIVILEKRMLIVEKTLKFQ